MSVNRPPTATATLGQSLFDVDGALSETAGRLPTRGQFIRRGGRRLAAGAVGGAGLALGIGFVPGSAHARSEREDLAILNFALALEYLQASFYTEAERVGALHGPLAQQARVVGSHERAHVAALRAVLGRQAIARPRFDFRGTTDDPKSFRATAVALEDLSVGAYKEQLPRINSDHYLAAAVAIQSVEGRHAAWIRRLAGIVPAVNAFDEPVSDRRTVQLVNATRFVTLKVPHTSSKRSPSFTG
ncbi:MAG TPA: ferritin-like domain-containing protein [Solirubrobacteraceae bacterium]|nr:ferritin-like domain-containing protein [Solirubrobacteraceae bacterium]